MKSFSLNFNTDPDAETVQYEIAQLISERPGAEKELVTVKSEILETRKDIARFSEAVKSTFSKIVAITRPETNELILWLIATMITLGALFISLGKLFFDK